MNYLQFINENYIFSEKDFKININKWKPGTPLWITGTSGDGKSTLAKKLAAEKNGIVVHLDVFLSRINYDKKKWIEKSSKEDIYKNSMAMDYINQHPELPWQEQFSGWGNCNKKLWIDFFNWLIYSAKNNPKYNRKYIVIEGCDITFIDPKFIATQPLIIIGCSRMEAGRRRIKRDLEENHTLIDSIFRELKRHKKYTNALDNEKDKFKKNVKYYL